MRRSILLWLAAFLLLLYGATASGTAAAVFPAPDLTEDVVKIDLGRPQDSLRTGGGGRYLIFLCKEAKKLSILDVSQARVVHQLDLPSSDVQYAAGLEKLMVVVPGQKMIHRYSLQDFRREKTVPLPDDSPVKNVLMGSGSKGPLFLWYGAEGKFLDIEQMKPLQLKGDLIKGSTFFTRKTFELRVSSDGRTFIGWAKKGGQAAFSRSSWASLGDAW